MTNLGRRFPVIADDRVALVTADGGQVSYGALGEMVGAARGGLADAGLAVGDRVMLIGANSDLEVVFHLACVTAGLVSMPVDPETSPAEIARLIDLHHPVAVIADAVGATALAASNVELAGTRHVIASSGDRLALLDHAWVPGTDVDDDHPAVLSATPLSTVESPRGPQTHGEQAAVIDAMVSNLGEPTGGEPLMLATGPLHDPAGLDMLHAGLAVGATIMVGGAPEPDRTDDIIVVSGIEVSAVEVERVVSAHESVDAVSVVGEPDETTGERLVAYVATTPVPTVGERPGFERELIEFCGERLEASSVPRRIVFTTSIPPGLGDRRTRWSTRRT